MLDNFERPSPLGSGLSASRVIKAPKIISLTEFVTSPQLDPSLLSSDEVTKPLKRGAEMASRS